MTPRRFSTLAIGLTLLTTQGLALALDVIPEDMPGWTEKGVVLQNISGAPWENKAGISVAGVSKVNGTYYLFYLAGFNGCWNNDGDVNHQSIGLATSTDGNNFTRYSGNPVLIPHDFVPVGSHEEGIRTGNIQYIPSKDKFYGYFGVESPGGSGSCNLGGSGSCECNVGVDAQVFLGTSNDGKSWKIEGSVDGAYAKSGSEVYASGWVYNGSQFGLYAVAAEGGQAHSVSRGSNALNLAELGKVSALNWGWSGLDAYLHDDNNTMTLMYNPHGGNHSGSSNDKLYFATAYLNDIAKIHNERVVVSNGTHRNVIIRDNNQWKWYYSDDASWNNQEIRLRTHPLTNLDSVAPAPPGSVSAK